MKRLLKSIKTDIKDFTKKVVKNLEPKCIILFGSLARGDFNERSDVDIIIISPNLPKSYFERAELLYSLIRASASIDPIGYTPNEFVNMIKKRHCTSLFAMEEGKPLFGKKYFSFLIKTHNEIFKKYEIFKGDSAWIPKILDQI